MKGSRGLVKETCFLFIFIDTIQRLRMGGNAVAAESEPVRTGGEGGAYRGPTGKMSASLEESVAFLGKWGLDAGR